MKMVTLETSIVVVIVALMFFMLGVYVGRNDMRSEVRDDMGKCKVENYCHSDEVNISVDAFGRVKVHKDK